MVTPHCNCIQNHYGDGKGCSSQESACCQAAGIPWFHKRLNASTNDYIELRICSDASASSNEDIPVGYYEIVMSSESNTVQLLLV